MNHDGGYKDTAVEESISYDLFLTPRLDLERWTQLLH